MKDLRGTFVKVKKIINYTNVIYGGKNKLHIILLIKSSICLLLIDVSCPGSQQRCNGNGFCDLTNGVCTCDEGYQGLDCSGNN